MADRKTIRLQTIGVLVPPEVETDGANLYWSLRRWAETGRVGLASPTRLMLDRFVALVGAKPETICAFARKYGVLGICAQHKMPSSHDWDCDLIPGPSAAWWAEPVDLWRFYAGQFRAVLRIGNELNKGRLGQKEDWAILDPDQDSTFSKPSHKTILLTGLAGARERLAEVVFDLTEVGAVRLTLMWENGQWKTFYHGIGNERLFGALAIQLMLAVASVDGFATCSACGNPYIPERTPKANQHNFCSLPCRKTGWAVSSRIYRISKLKRAQHKRTK
jgi:hypothetical protein